MSTDCSYSPRASMAKLKRYLKQKRKKECVHSEDRWGNERPGLIVGWLNGNGVSGIFLCQRIIANLDQKFRQLNESEEMVWMNGQRIVIILFGQFELISSMMDQSTHVEHLM